MDLSASKRLAVLENHVLGREPTTAAAEGKLQPSLTSSSSSGGGQRDGYCVVLPERLTPHDPWLVRRNADFSTQLIETFPAPDDDIRTLYDTLESSIAKYKHLPYLGKRSSSGQYDWMTYGECGNLRNAIGSGLVHGFLGSHISSNSPTTFGLYSINCPEWVLVDAALHAFSMTSVPLYDTLGPDAVKYIANHAELAGIACSLDVLGRVLEVLPDCPSVKVVVVYGTTPGQRLPSPGPGVEATLVTLDRLSALGYKHPKPHRPPGPSDIALINYTSGTTGTPKGAVLTHGALVANAAGAARLVADLFLDGEQQQKHISYLPLAHIYERFNLTLQTYFGGAVGFYRGNVLELLEDVEVLAPTVFSSVPRLYNRIYDKVLAQVQSAGPVSRQLFWMAYNSKKAAIEGGDLSGGRWAPLWDRLVFSKVRARLGGQVKLLTSGASPISPEVFTFLRICFGCHVLEGYGMTETACLISITPLGDATSGHVGAPNPACEVKLADVPEMGYTNADVPLPRGEICVRGPILFRGYYKDEGATREAIDEDGWLHTGDIGVWVPGGRLKIIDRKKNIFKLAQGEYIAPEKIENVLARSPFVLQSFVYGNSLRSQLVSIIVPDPEYLLPWASDRGMKTEEGLEGLCRDPRVVAAVLKSVREEGRVAGLKGFEQVAAVTLTPEPFSVDNGLMTPTFKIKRPQAQAAFQEAIAEMYASLSEG